MMARSMHSDWWQMPDFLTEGIMRTALKPAICATMIALAAMSGAANAAPLTQLHFTQASAYDPTSLDFDNSQGLVPAFSDSNRTFSWTSPPSGTTSSLTIESYNSGQTEAAAGDANGEWNAGEWFRIDQLIQRNQVLSVPGGVPVPNPLWIADIIGTFAVYQNADFSNALLPGGSDTTTTTLKYWETLNEDNLDQCDGPTPLGSLCDDEYTVLALSLAPLSFILDDYIYEISFRLEPGAGTTVCVKDALSPECEAAGVTFDADELIKVYAAEQEQSNLFVAAAWTATQIPEPGVLGLLGIGLMGMGLSARRRKATAA
jgi:hypothetical protein